MSDHLLFTLSGDGLCDVACVLLLKPDVCLVCYAVVVVRTTSLCLSLQQIDGTYALCVMRWLSSVQPPFVLACSKQIGTLSNILFLWKQMSFLLWKTEKTDVIFALKNREKLKTVNPTIVWNKKTQLWLNIIVSECIGTHSAIHFLRQKGKNS